MSNDSVGDRNVAWKADPREVASLAAAEFLQRETIALWSLLEALGAQDGIEALEEALRISDETWPDPKALGAALLATAQTLSAVTYRKIGEVEQADSKVADIGAAVRWSGARLTDLADRLKRAG